MNINLSSILNNIASNLKNYLILGMAILIIGGFFYHDYEVSKLQKETLYYQNSVAQQSLVIQNKDSSYSKLSQQLTSASDANAFLASQNATLAKQLKKDDEKIASLISAQVAPETVYTGPVSYTNITKTSENWTAYKKPFKVSGVLSLGDSTKQRIDSVNVEMDQFKILAVEGKLKNGYYNATIKLTDLNGVDLPGFPITNITSAVNENNTKVTDYFDIGFGGQVSLFNALDLGGLIRIADKNNITVGYRLIDNNVNLSKFGIFERLRFGYYRTF